MRFDTQSSGVKIIRHRSTRDFQAFSSLFCLPSTTHNLSHLIQAFETNREAGKCASRCVGGFDAESSGVTPINP